MDKQNYDRKNIKKKNENEVKGLGKDSHPFAFPMLD
jgi:hypothetical protein